MRKCIEDVMSLQLRLKKIIGQLSGVQKMLAEDVPCEDILTQLNAANGALHRLSFIVLDGHLRHCVREGIEKGNADETIAIACARASKKGTPTRRSSRLPKRWKASRRWRR